MTDFIRSVDLLLVNPGNRVEQFSCLAPLATVAPPLGIALLAAYVRERGISVAIFDAEDNIYWYKGSRICKICRKEQSGRSKLKKKTGALW